MDPHVVLGGFPTQVHTSSHSSSPSPGGAGGMPVFRNYSADATAFVVTLPLSSRPGDLEVRTVLDPDRFHWILIREDNLNPTSSGSLL